MLKYNTEIFGFRYLATGCTLTEMSYNFRIGRSTLSIIVNDVCRKIWDTFHSKYLKEMIQSDWENIAREFEKKANFPMCLGAIDGKHIRIESFPHSGSMNYNYKQYYSIVLLAIVDADYKFLFVDIGAYGKDCDSSILKDTEFYKRLERGELNIPDAKPIAPDGLKVPYIFIGDNAFAINEHILKDFSNHNLSVKQRVFNFRLHRARRYVECAFGIFSNKWRIFHRPVNVSKVFSKNIVKACVILHNIVRIRDGHRNEDLMIASGSRLQNLMDKTQSTHKTGQGVRTCFANYFVSQEGQLPWQLSKILFTQLTSDFVYKNQALLIT